MSKKLPNSFRSGPDERGHFGNFGGRFVAETLMPLILEVEKAYTAAKADPAFHADLQRHHSDFSGQRQAGRGLARGFVQQFPAQPGQCL